MSCGECGFPFCCIEGFNFLFTVCVVQLIKFCDLVRNLRLAQAACMFAACPCAYNSVDITNALCAQLLIIHRSVLFIMYSHIYKYS